MLRSRGIISCSLAGLLLLCATAAWSQAKKPAKDREKKEPSPATVRTLETQAEKAKNEYVKGLIEVAKGFEEQGLTDKTKETLRSILTVAPEFEAAKNRLTELEQAIFSENVVEVEVDATKPWTPVGIAVARDKAVRLAADGSVRVILNDQAGPEGLDSGDPTTGMVKGVPLGALIGVIRDPAEKDARVDPFMVGKEMELTPRSKGLLYLKVNLPPNTQSKGKIRVQISGHFSKLSPGGGN